MNRRSTLVAVAAALSVVPVSWAQAPAYNPDLISNWAAPLYWQPPVNNSEGSIHRGRIRESAFGRMAVVGTIGSSPAVFVAMTPCRVIDTRNPTGPFGGPAFGAGETRTYAIPSGPCSGIPANAVAYSFNIGVIPQAGTLAWLTAWNAGVAQPLAATLNDSQGAIVANAAVVPAGTPNGSVSIFAHDPTHVIVDVNGYYLPNADLSGNTQLGIGALATVTTGPNNTAIGRNALGVDTVGSANTAIGATALQSNSSGTGNSAIGSGALGANTSGINNTAIGEAALSHNTTGNNNTGIGFDALGSSTTGSNNFGIGNAAGSAAGINGNWNVHIANQGVAGDTNLIRIGDANQSKTYISGIYAVTPGSAAVPVFVDASGQLGTSSSSRITKQDIAEMGDTTSTIMSLHPVRFHYKAWGPDSQMQYGLIAEDVAEVAPDLVARTPKGDITTVYYDKVNAMVLNQVQEQQRLIDKQTALIQQLESRIAELENQR